MTACETLICIVVSKFDQCNSSVWHLFCWWINDNTGSICLGCTYISSDWLFVVFIINNKKKLIHTNNNQIVGHWFVRLVCELMIQTRRELLKRSSNNQLIFLIKLHSFVYRCQMTRSFWGQFPVKIQFVFHESSIISYVHNIYDILTTTRTYLLFVQSLKVNSSWISRFIRRLVIINHGSSYNCCLTSAQLCRKTVWLIWKWK